MLNKVSILGRMGRDPEARSLTSGEEVVNLRVATSERWKNKDGEKQERTEWHSVVIWNQHLAKVAKQYLHKGDLVYLEGTLQTRKWEKDGTDHYTTEVVLQKFGGDLRLMPKQGDADHHDEDRPRSSSAKKPAAKASATALEDDDIPF
jgi:single-strand DNA-binding protein